jgi:hypothetical protein
MKLIPVTLAALAAVGIALASPAAADVNDDAYIDALHDVGISNSTGDQALIVQGHEIAYDLEHGTRTPMAEAALVYAITDISFGTEDAKNMVRIATHYYAPELEVGGFIA